CRSSGQTPPRHATLGASAFDPGMECRLPRCATRPGTAGKIMIGRSVSHYQIVEKLGAGGMGEIYRAQDARLNRNVAIKVLHGAHSGSEERRSRFLQEAKAASALNHPNIITIHDVVMEGDAEYIVMEYVTGKTLADLIPPGGMALANVLNY